MSDRTTEPRLELETEGIACHFPMSRRRMGNRRRNEADIAMRWLMRFVRRTHSTITRAPVVFLENYCAEHWHLGARCLGIKTRIISGGQRYGLPERYEFDADVLSIPPQDSLRRPETWDRILGGS